MIIGLIVFLLIYIFINYFIGKRILKSFTNIKNINPKIFWIIFSFISSSYIIFIIFKNSLPLIISKVLGYIGCYYLAILFYLILLFPLCFFSHYFLRNSHFKVDLYLISFIIAITLLPIGSFFSFSPVIKNYDIQVNKPLKNSVNITLVSDIHLGEIISTNKLNTMISKINSTNPDVVVIAGDLIDSDLYPVLKNHSLDSLKNITSKYGTYFSLGNHDVYTDKIDELTHLLEDQNITVLRDNMKLIDNSFYLIGRDDIAINNTGTTRSSLTEILSTNHDYDINKPTVLIDHNPDYISDAINSDIDLQLSGHTHKGQMFPLNYGTNFVFPIDYGYKKFLNTNVVVTSGFGTWGPPIRIGSRCEIVLINLHN